MSRINSEDALNGTFYKSGGELVQCISPGLNSDGFRLFINQSSEIRTIWQTDRVRTLPTEATDFNWAEATWDVSDAVDSLAVGQRVCVKHDGSGFIKQGATEIFAFANKAELDVYVGT